MPLTRYQIRNEYSLADPELYRAADREDPEAILEGVAMAGLVGVLRQLGDLAEFAAEIFHDLHEEVMVTAARGHGLMVRVQQLEAEFPSIEKAFLSQTNHSSFFSNAGIDWHPNLHTEQNLLTRGDLPRCVMDSYEECRGPPRLFLLDKFDGAGAGACLKRYTDPSFFKAESASSGIATVEVHREKKVRKAKKKGSRWRNGGTPEILPTSHPKLLQLFLEERVENGFSDPARLVKLKKRQLNRSLLDSKSGKSYMEKFLGTPSPEHKEVCEIPAAPPPLKLTPDNSGESGLEVLEIGTVGPVKKSLQGKESPRSSPNAQEVLVKPSMEELNEDVIDREIVKVSEPTAYGEIHEIPSTLPKVMVEKELAVDGAGNTEGSVDGDHYDDVASEVDNYVDALTTMESEMDTDNEYRHKNNLGFLNVEKHGIDSDANEEQLEVQGHFSDTQSIENSIVSDDGNSSFKKERSSFSYSDTLSNLAENTPSDSEAAAKVFPSTETCVAEIVDTPSNQLPVSEEILETKSHELVMLNDMCIDEGKIADPGEPSCSSCLMETNSLLLPLDPGVNSLVVLSVGPALNDTPSESVEFGSKLPNIDENRTNLADSSAAVSAIPSQTRDDCHFMDSAESNYLDELDVEDSNVSSDALLASEKKSSNVLQIDHTDETCAENLAEGKTGSPQSIISPAEDQFPCSALPIEELYSGITLLLDSSDVVRPDDLVSEMGDAMQATGGSSESLTPTVDTSEAFDKQKFSDVKDDVPQAVLDSKEVGVPYSEENTNLDEISRTADGEETGGFNYKVDAVEGDAVPLELPSNCPDNPGLDDHISSDDIVAETAEADVTMSAAAASAGDDVNDVYCSSPDLSSNDIITETFKADVAISAAASAGDDINDVVCPSPDLSSVDIVTENVKADVAMSAAAAAAATGAGDDINDVVCPSPDLICSPSRRSVNFPESPSGSGNLYQEGLEFNEAFSPEYVLESKAEKELNQLEVAPTDLDSFPCKSVSYGYSNDVIFDDVHDSSLVEQPQNSSHVSDVTTAPASSEPNNQELESESLHQSHPLENGKDAVFSPTCSIPGNKIILEQSLNLQADQVEVECWEADEASFKSSNLGSEQLQSLNHRDQARCFDASSECCPEDFPNQPLSSEFLPQSTGQELDGTKRAMDSLVSVLPSFGLLPEGAQVSVREMPPLPPLPPMQWRIGKVQHAPLAMERELVEHSQQSFPSILPFTADEKAQFGFPALGGVIAPPGNPFLPVEAVEDERPQHVSEQLVDHLAQPTTLSSQLPTMVNDANGRHNSLALEGIESLNPFLTFPAISTERPEQGFLALESEMTHPSSNPFASVPAVEYTTSRHDVVSSQENLTQPLNLLAPETGLEAKSLQHAPQNSEGEHGNSFVTSLSPPTNVEEQPQHDLPISEGQTAWTAWPSNTLALPPTFEVGKPNGNPPAKLPRPRSPLVDALAAHDKSMLRKVTERVRPQIGSKVDERDSLLEQIRTKSFNLKPAMVSRPSIQGPKTNLKVAAILEKANAIRQALAGSDEDDDEDNWSDS